MARCPSWRVASAAKPSKGVGRDDAHSRMALRMEKSRWASRGPSIPAGDISDISFMLRHRCFCNVMYSWEQRPPARYVASSVDERGQNPSGWPSKKRCIGDPSSSEVKRTQNYTGACGRCLPKKSTVTFASPRSAPGFWRRSLPQYPPPNARSPRKYRMRNPNSRRILLYLYESSPK